MIDNSNSYKDRVSRLISWGHWFMFANIVLAMVMALRYIFAVETEPTFTAVFYILTTWIGHFGLLGILAYIIILFPLTFIFPSSKIMRALGAIIATIAIVTLLIDGSVFGNYQLHLNLMAFDLEGFNLNNSIGWSSIGLFLLALLFVELTIANLIWKRLAIIRAWDIGNKLTLVFGGAFLLSHLIHIWADATVYRPVLVYDRIFPLSHQSTARNLIKKYGWIGETHQDKLSLSAAPQSITYPLNPLQCNVSSGQNLLFISIAQINRAHVSAQTMPNLAAFATSSIYAKNHITTSLAARDIEFTLATGLPANYRSVFERNKLSSPLISLTNDHRRKRFGTNQSQQAQPEHQSAAHDQQNVRQLLQWIAQHKQQPYIADITLYASQALSAPDDFHPTIALPDSLQRPAARLLATQYLKAIAYTDQLIAQILAVVDLSNTTLVITGNRGADLNAIYQRSESYSAVNLEVPLIIATPNTAAQQITKRTSHYDVMPTLLRHHFRCGNPAADSSIGFDILSTQHSSLFYIGASENFAIYQKDGIVEFDRQGNFRFFTKDYARTEHGKLSFQQLIDLKANINRFK